MTPQQHIIADQLLSAALSLPCGKARQRALDRRDDYLRRCRERSRPTPSPEPGPQWDREIPNEL